VLIVGFIVFMVVLFIVAVNAGQPRLPYDGSGGTTGIANVLAPRSVPARGIMLSVSSTARSARYNGQRFEIRRGRVDVEEVGGQPYTIDTDIYIPSNLARDVLPGSTMELRVDPSNATRVYVIGPDVAYAQGAVRTS